MSQMTFSDYEYSLRKRKTKREENHLGEVFFKAINRVMEATGHIMHGGTIVDAAIISAPSSTKNAEKKRDPEMYQTKRKCAVRCKVEHAFKIIKDTFGFRKVRYRGLAKNFNKLNVLFACANLLMVKRGQIKSQKALIRGSVYPFADNRLQMKLEKLKNSSILVKILLF